MKVLWPHNFNPDVPNSLVYVNIMASGLRDAGVDLHLEYLGNLRSMPNLIRARSRVREMANDFDLVHAQYGSACALAAAAAEDVPKVVSIRGNDWNVHSDSFGFSYVHTRLAFAMSHLAMARYDCVLTVSERMARAVRGRFPQKFVLALPSPVDLRKFVPLDRKEARARLGYPGNEEKWVLFNALNLNDPIKRYGLAQEVCALASKRRGDIRLRVANDLPHTALPLFVAACDVLLCTSETEGWPNSVKEALACNVPFVATDISDLGEIAAQEPTCRVGKADAQGLADRLCDVLEMPAPTDLRRFVAAMGIRESAGRLAGIYRQLIDSRRGEVQPRPVAAKEN